MNFYVYILYSDVHDRFYIGQTNDLEKRLDRHNKGYVKSTKAYKPWRLLYYEKYNSRSEAMKREGYLKSLKSKAALKDLIESTH